MTKESIQAFADSKVTEATIIAVKSEGTDAKGNYHLHTTAYIKELSGVIASIDSWKEDELVKKMQGMYGCLRQFEEKDGITNLPETLDFTVEYISEEEWYNRIKE